LSQVLPGGLVDTVPQLGSTRATVLDFQTPFRFGAFNWDNSLRVEDDQSIGRDTATTTNPADSSQVTRIYPGTFSTSLDWDTGINLPVLFRGSWKLQPSVGVANVTSSPFMVRNRNTNGQFVTQGKRFRFSASVSPTLFAFYPGLGLASRIRHSLSPTLNWTYSPAASVSEQFARAVALPGQPIQLRSEATQTMSLGLSQTFEAKAKTRPGDSSSVEARKFRVLSINTSPIGYDFEQAKQPGRTGWVTDVVTNSFLSDLLPQFTLSLTHDLWRGPVGTDAAKFAPFLSSVSSSFAISSNTLRAIGSIFGLGGGNRSSRGDRVPSSYVVDPGRRNRPSAFYNTGQVPFSQSGRGFSANFNYTLSRTRPEGSLPAPPTQQNLGFSTSFSPTAFWSLSWSSQYNITGSKFESQVVRLERVLHEWRAGFNFVRNANGNFAFYFSIYLTDLPDLKFDYNQTTFER
jgi:LptD protein